MSNCDCQQYQKQFGVIMQNTIAIVGANSGKNTNANKEKLGKIVEATPQLNCCRMETQGLYKGEMFFYHIDWKQKELSEIRWWCVCVCEGGGGRG